MIAIVGYLKYLKNDFAQQNITATARLKIVNLDAIIL